MLRSLIICLVGLFFTSIAIIALFSVSSLILQQIHERLKLKENSQLYKIWRNVPLPVYNRYYFFNVTNVDDIEKNGAKPIIKEIGPFTYRVYLKKNIIQYNNNNNTISYREHKSWLFIPKLSINNDTAIITTLNTPLVITFTLLQNITSSIRAIVTLALGTLNEGLFIKRTVRELLFEGYNEHLATFGPLLNPSIPANNGKFAYMYKKNNSDDGLFNIFNGMDNINKLNLINQYNGENQLKYWTSSECNNFNGSTNEQLRPPIINDNTLIKIFIPDICRILKLVYNSNNDNNNNYHNNSYNSNNDNNYNKSNNNNDDLKLNRYILDENTFKNSIDYPPNSCYISKIRDFQVNNNNNNNHSNNMKIFPSGVFDVSVCKYGSPILISQPHFLNSDKFYMDTIDGLKPEKDRHEFIIDIDPFTGITINLYLRLQLNIAMNKISKLFKYRHIPDIVIPIYWQEYKYELTKELLDLIKDARILPQLISSIIFYLLLSFGLILILISLLIYLLPMLREYNPRLVNGNQENTVRRLRPEDIGAILDRRFNSDYTGIDNEVSLESS